MIIDNKIQELIYEDLVALDSERSALHEPSGLLSASMLYQPLRFQIMKSIGIPTKTIEPYVLGKFQRGNDVEDWYVGKLEKFELLEGKQVEVHYKGAIGYIDAVVRPEKLNFKECNVHEVKSVTNAKLKQIATTGKVDYHYRLQGTFYALARGEKYYAIDIISAEDLRVTSYIFDVADTQKDVDEIIAKYDQAMEAWKRDRTLPVFEVHPEVPWTANLEYAPFSVEVCEMSDEQIRKLYENNN